MGRGNVYSSKVAQDAVWYVDNERFYMCDENDEVSNEWDDGLFEMEIDYFKELMMSADKSLVKPFKERYAKRDELVILENNLIEIRMIDNEWATAFVVFEQEYIDNDEYDETAINNEISRVGQLVKSILLEMYQEIHRPNGAWMSEAVKRDA